MSAWATVAEPEEIKAKPDAWKVKDSKETAQTGFISKQLALKYPIFSRNVNIDNSIRLVNNLNTLLQLDIIPFWSTILYPVGTSCSSFLTYYFKADLKSLPAELSKLVFSLICRLSLAPEENGDESGIKAAFGNAPGYTERWMAGLKKNHILDIAQLINVSQIFGRFNQVYVRKIMSSHKVYQIGNEFDDGVKLMIHVFETCLKSVAKKVEKLAGGGKGKGKGRLSDTVSSPLRSSTSSVESVATINGVEAALTQGELLLWDQSLFIIDTLFTMDNFVLSLSPDLVSAFFFSSKKFIDILIGCFDMANNIRKVISTQSFQDSNLDFLENLTENTRIIKFHLVSLLYHLVDIKFFEPVGLGDFVKDNKKTNKNAEMVNPLCDFVHHLLELSSDIPEGNQDLNWLNDTPLILDMEIAFDLSKKFSMLKDSKLDPTTDSRIDFLVTSLNDLLNATGLAGTKNSYQSKKRRKTTSRAVPPQLPPRPVVSNEASSFALPTGLSSAEDHTTKKTFLISKIQELFPTFGDGFIELCLTEYSDNVEEVIDKIITQSLPPHLSSQPTTLTRQQLNPPANTIDPKTVLESRRNVFDGDEFDVFSSKLDESKVHIGKKSKKEPKVDKERILSAHRAQLIEEMYDDEYNDTYDSNDIRLAGTIEAGAIDDDIDNMEKEIYHPLIAFEPEWIEMINNGQAAFFTSAEKLSQKRIEYKARTGLSNEQIEGWYIMYKRNPKKIAIGATYDWKGNKVRREDMDDDEFQKGDSMRGAAPLPPRGGGNMRGYGTRDNGMGRGQPRGQGQGQGGNRGQNQRGGGNSRGRGRERGRERGRGGGGRKY